jgi:peroxiredoxin
MSLAINNPTLFTSNLIRLELKPIPEIGITPDGRNSFLKQRWWVDANLRDIRFTNSLALEAKLWGFIELYIENGYDREQQDSAFVAGAKAVMTLNAAPAIRGYLRSILIKSYLDSDYDAVTKYLYETPFDSLAPLKLTPEEKNSYEIQGKNRVGTKANDMRFATIDGATLKLSKINARFKLVFFWSMWCPHCTEMLPELYRTYLKYKGNGFEVIAISIDDEIDGWRKFVNERKQNWINTIEPDNGKSKIVSEYNVDGTPKLFLLDENMTIISRPSNVKQLEAKLKGILH